ncbi:spore germination protein KC [Anaerobacterium chartisolvens]|uniref:Spore germination protein KC n=1 Tax=Anaerobacterium chartisolvens TaxID=1297424 RepID=A0A369AUX0_9FIRM|nr:Ger(x)C family spore germination protein [Anaerobacterium chartisolvens]RCX13001.1 spore germination protein KC [Anaerobacterium chartisolvens]
MKRKADIFILAVLFILLMFTTGCWDYREISEEIIVAGAAFDYDEKNDCLVVTAEITLPKSSEKGSTFNSKIYTSKGKSVIDAVNKLTSKAGHKLLWSHSKVIILSEELIESENLFIGIMDWVKRDLETRDYVWMLLSKEKTAGEIFLKADPQTESIISYYLDHVFLTVKSNETYMKVPYWEFMYSLQSEDFYAVLPTVTLEESDKGAIPLVNGTEIISRNKAICWLDGNQTKTLLLIMDKLRDATFIVEQTHNEKRQTVSLRILGSKTRIKPILGEKGLVMEVRVQMEASVSEIDGSKDIFKKENIKELEKEAERMITGEIKELVNLLKEKYKVDAVRFGDKVENKYPKLWKQMKNDWGNEFEKISSDIQVKLEITASDQSMKITKAGR